MVYSLREIAESVGGEIRGDEGVRITGVNALQEAREGEISFFADPRLKDLLGQTKASALIVSRQTDSYPGPQLLAPNPMLCFAMVAALFAPPPPRFQGISPAAVVHETSRIGDNVCIYPQVYVGRETIIGNDVILFPGSFLGDRVQIGDRTILYPNVTVLQDCIVGRDVVIHAGTVIGSDGFGFVRDGARNVKIPQTGYVQIDDQVELGANNSVDRATMGRTWIRRGVKTDNLVQIAHNVVIGEDTIIVAQAGISGSVRIGREVVIGGQVGISDHLEIGDRAMIGSQSGVAKSIPPGEIVSGTPTMSHRLWLKTRSLIARLPLLSDRLRALEKRLEELEKRIAG
ncbi:MAG: UDP-3-O-(3-hydroxymyristoyl)glucosamine N-acyltransferase [Deltaproteobacteria bacterium]|nr:UDP-3-O-(3-hydroxymyristoyl)glucosamine N-acyltransferase [Deltaproteobacteria bacterium]